MDAGSGFLFSGVASRLLQTLWPSKLEKAQTRNALETLELNLRRFESEEERYRRDREDRREIALAQRDMQLQLHASGLKASRDLELERQTLNRWPLDALPEDIIRTSRAREYATPASAPVSRPLNVIFKISSVLGQGLKSEQAYERLTQSALMAAMSRLRGRAGYYFHGDLVTYTSDVNDGGSRWHRDASLSSTVYSRLWTEPVALVELFVERAGRPATADVLASPARVGVAMSHWGWVGETPDGSPTLAPPFETEGIFYFDFDLEDGHEAGRVDDTLLAVMTGLRDAYVTLTSLRRPAPLTMFRILPELPAVSFWRYGEGSRPVQLGADAMLRGAHRGIVQGIVAERAPLFAVEAAAQASLDAKAAGDAVAERDYLELTIANARNAVTDGPQGHSAFVGHIVEADVNCRLPTFRKAVAGLMPTPANTPSRKARPSPGSVGLRQAGRMLTPPKR